MYFLNNNDRYDDKGFTLLEIVITVGILMLMSSVGVVTVRGFDNRTKEQVAAKAAREVYNVARASLEDNKPATNPGQVADDYNNSQKTVTSNGNRPITVKVSPRNATSPTTPLKVTAYYDGGRISAVYDPQGSDSGSGSGGTTGGGTTIPVIQDTVSKFTFQCDSDTSGYLPIFNVSDDATVSLVGSNGDEKLVNYKVPSSTLDSVYGTIDFTKYTSGFNNVSEKLTMKANATYTVNVYGTFENLSVVREGTKDSSFRECLVSVDKLGKDSGIISINSIGGAKTINMPTSIPSTVTNLITAFKDMSNFDSPNIASWDTSKVNSLAYAFYNASSFNRNISSWDTSSVTSISATFSGASVYNNGGSALTWNTSKLTSTGYAFRYASSFNQDLPWDTSNVQTMVATFQGAKSFNGNISGWNVSKVTNMSSMFLNASSFNNTIIRTSAGAWDTSNVANMTSMFEGASMFNKSITNWRTQNVTSMDKMFKNASKFNSNISGWDVSKVTNYNSFDEGATSFNSTYKPLFK